MCGPQEELWWKINIWSYSIWVTWSFYEHITPNNCAFFLKWLYNDFILQINDDKRQVNSANGKKMKSYFYFEDTDCLWIFFCCKKWEGCSVSAGYIYIYIYISNCKQIEYVHLIIYFQMNDDKHRLHSKWKGAQYSLIQRHCIVF